jgi:hypothetical protein
MTAIMTPSMGERTMTDMTLMMVNPVENMPVDLMPTSGTSVGREKSVKNGKSKKHKKSEDGNMNGVRSGNTKNKCDRPKKNIGVNYSSRSLSHRSLSYRSQVNRSP